MFSTEERALIQKTLDQVNGIPSEQIITSHFSNGVDKCCVVGHLVRLASENPSDYSVENCRDFHWNGGLNTSKMLPIRGLVAKFVDPRYPNPIDPGAQCISYVNNGMSSKYEQATPKERVVAVLEDMLAVVEELV